MNQQAMNRLTDRQKDCLRLVARGYTSKEIGRQLALSPSTVDNHVLAATQMLSAPSRAEAARNLISIEARQKLPSQPSGLAEPVISGMTSMSAEVPRLQFLGRKVGSLPPVGGYRNDLNGTERTIRIMQVAAVGFGTIISLTLVIAGIFKLFS
jgi:DNA-binding CsgD family transcriptional regulator